MDKIKEFLETLEWNLQSRWNDNGTECYMFMKNNSDLLKLEFTPDADEDILEEIRGENDEPAEL